MGFDHSLNFGASVRPGTPVEEVADAMAAVLHYHGYGADDFNRLSGDNCLDYGPENGHLSVYFSGPVSYDHSDRVEQMAASLGRIVIEAGEIHLRDFNTGDLENAITTFYFGPTPEAIEDYQFKKELESSLAALAAYLDAEALEKIREAALAGAKVKAAPPTPEQIYVQKGGSCCPFCGSDQIEGSSIDVDGGHALQKVGCNDCDAEWNDVYRLSGYEEIA